MYIYYNVTVGLSQRFPLGGDIPPELPATSVLWVNGSNFVRELSLSTWWTPTHTLAHARMHTHTQGRVLGVTSWITSFGPRCIISSSAVINSDVPTGMRPHVLQCTLNARMRTRTTHRAVPSHIVMLDGRCSVLPLTLPRVSQFYFGVPTDAAATKLFFCSVHP